MGDIKAVVDGGGEVVRPKSIFAPDDQIPRSLFPSYILGGLGFDHDGQSLCWGVRKRMALNSLGSARCRQCPG